jgi:hypothetical protein
MSNVLCTAPLTIKELAGACGHRGLGCVDVIVGIGVMDSIILVLCWGTFRAYLHSLLWMSRGVKRNRMLQGPQNKIDGIHLFLDNGKMGMYYGFAWDENR